MITDTALHWGHSSSSLAEVCQQLRVLGQLRPALALHDCGGVGGDELDGAVLDHARRVHVTQNEGVGRSLGGDVAR